MIGPDAKRVAVEQVADHPMVRFAARKRDPERIGMIADVVWAGCEAVMKPPHVGDSTALQSFCEARLKGHQHYNDLVSFLSPLAIFLGILKLIISLLIDFWFKHEGLNK